MGRHKFSEMAVNGSVSSLNWTHYVKKKMNWKKPPFLVCGIDHSPTSTSRVLNGDKTVPVLGFSGALHTTACNLAFETPWAPGIRLLHFYGIITLSLPHKKWDVRVQNCWWGACSSAGAFGIWVSLCCGSAEKASAFTEKRINNTTIEFGNKYEALFSLLLLEV